MQPDAGFTLASGFFVSARPQVAALYGQAFQRKFRYGLGDPGQALP